jgi:hypothetical protein
MVDVETSLTLAYRTTFGSLRREVEEKRQIGIYMCGGWNRHIIEVERGGCK